MAAPNQIISDWYSVKTLRTLRLIAGVGISIELLSRITITPVFAASAASNSAESFWAAV